MSRAGSPRNWGLSGWPRWGAQKQAWWHVLSFLPPPCFWHRAVPPPPRPEFPPSSGFSLHLASAGSPFSSPPTRCFLQDPPLPKLPGKGRCCPGRLHSPRPRIVQVVVLDPLYRNGPFSHWGCVRLRAVYPLLRAQGLAPSRCSVNVTGMSGTLRCWAGRPDPGRVRWKWPSPLAALLRWVTGGLEHSGGTPRRLPSQAAHSWGGSCSHIPNSLNVLGDFSNAFTSNVLCIRPHILNPTHNFRNI